MSQEALMKTDLPGFPEPKRGKVRDIYDFGSHLLIVATDRISAFDVIMANGIPGKGKILTAMSVFWLQWIKKELPVVRTHFITADMEKICSFYRHLRPYRSLFEGRAMLVYKVKILPVEAVVRGYLYGSAWQEYKEKCKEPGENKVEVCGLYLPRGLKQGDRLLEAIFTPTTKARTGHDENISWDKTQKMISYEMAVVVRSLALMLYLRAAEYAKSRGVIIMDTKFEFGENDFGIALADEVLTSDSSRFIRRKDWKPGGPQVAMDKQFLRDYLQGLCDAGKWDKDPTKPGPELPPDVVEETAKRYEQALQMLTN